MPLYEFTCGIEPCGALREVLMSLREYEAGPDVRCTVCGAPMVRIMLPSHINANALSMSPIIYEEAPDGRMRFPGRDDQAPKDGFERKEVRTMREYEAFRRKVNHTENNKIEQANEAEHAFLHWQEHFNRRELRSAMESMSPAYRAFAMLAIQKGNSRPKSFDSGFYCEAMEMDASNRDRFDDADRRGRARK